MKPGRLIFNKRGEVVDVVLNDAEMLARQHHRADCPGCELCLTGDCKIDRSYADAPDLDIFSRTLRPGT